MMLIERPVILFKNLKMNNWKTIKAATTICKFQGCQLGRWDWSYMKQNFGGFPDFHTRKLKIDISVYFSRSISDCFDAKLFFLQ